MISTSLECDKQQNLCKKGRLNNFYKETNPLEKIVELFIKCKKC